MGSDDPVNATLYKNYSKNFRKGIEQVYHSGGGEEFKANVSRFAAYKAYQVTQLARTKRIDKETGETFDQKKTAKATLAQFQAWQQAEYNTTVARARTAKQWELYSQPNRVRLFPNIKWLPSTSVERRPEHVAFYGRIWAKDDPFWESNTPGTLWNCKCGMQETNDGATENSDVPEAIPPRGLEGNPAMTGEIFTDNASYFKADEITLDKKTKEELPNLQRMFDRKPSEWRMDYYSDDKGFLAVERKRIEQAKINDVEIEKFNKEHSMCQTLAVNNQLVDYLKEVDGRYDILLNNLPADLKKTKSHNHIIDYVRHATRSQGAEIVVFEFESMTPQIHQKLNILAEKGYKIVYYTTREEELHYINTTPR